MSKVVEPSQAANAGPRGGPSHRTANDLEDFAYLASHDLKEPLRGISAYCEILLEDLDGKLDADARRRLRTMLGMCNRLDTMIDNLLAYWRLGHVPPAKSEVDLNRVVQDALRTLAPVIEQRRGRVRVAGPLPKAAADPSALGMVFANLISNGLKFNDSPQPCVEIGTSRSRPLTIYVRDNGIGVPREHRETIFALFRRLHSRKRAGLAIVRKIVESYGGRVWVDSEPGRGSSFYFSLGPATLPAAAAVRPDPAQARKPAAKPPHWTRPRKAAPARRLA